MSDFGRIKGIEFVMGLGFASRFIDWVTYPQAGCVHRDFFTLEVVRSQGASNELYDAYRPENGYFGDLMNGVGATRHFIG
ncbi:hypothetical protein GCM10008018_04420 [Paenibacillus marchantiophytorum]|uniref:Uncharacterized protein n=1 Tax=Paenibacillus marchantiophytorum TaxID=1619310 RepID=A0ABQ2BQW3_9BACL|nr:hypothetical protein GCM10008018_04420 [Paenibacillus marchantiophytorum]